MGLSSVMIWLSASSSQLLLPASCFLLPLPAARFPPDAAAELRLAMTAATAT